MSLSRATLTPDFRVRTVTTAELKPEEMTRIRALLDEAFGPGEDEAFDDDDWEHALGGVHFLAERDATILGHAAVVERELHAAGRPLRTGYVEAVAASPALQGSGIGTRVMRAVGAHIVAGFELGGLGTGSHGFYARLGWTTWRGPTSVRAPDGQRRTPDEDGNIMVLRTPISPPLTGEEPLSCDWRRGDVW